MAPIRVLIADDHAPFRRGLRVLLRGEADVEVVGEAADGREAVTQAERLQPDVVLMDLQMPVLDGLEATRRILTTAPHIRILALTMADDTATVQAALRAGARGYVLKGALKGEVLRAVRGVYGGDAVIGAAVAQQVLRALAQASPQAATAFPELTERELQILGLLARNRSNQEIADTLILSIKTVRNHVSNLCTKLNAADRTQAILFAREAGL
jgi:DNA-binding NarL/FixJ family response regulator